MGFSLLSVVVLVGIIGVIAVSLYQNAKLMRAKEAELERRVQLYDIANYIATNVSCTNSFYGLSCSASAQTVALKTGSGAVLISESCTQLGRWNVKAKCLNNEIKVYASHEACSADSTFVPIRSADQPFCAQP